MPMVLFPLLRRRRFCNYLFLRYMEKKRDGEGRRVMWHTDGSMYFLVLFNVAYEGTTHAVMMHIFVCDEGVTGSCLRNIYIANL